MTEYKKCICVKKEIAAWVILHRYDRAYVVRCNKCHCMWKTQAQYVSELQVYVPGDGLGKWKVES